MLITRSQGAACRRAAERIAELEPRTNYHPGYECAQPLMDIGWNGAEVFDGGIDVHQSQVLMALLWCAEIAGEA